MRPLPPAAAPSHGTFTLPWEADEAWVVTDPDELRSHLDGIPPARRRRVRVLGELSNTIPAEQVPGTVLLFRDGTGTRLEPVDDGTAL